MIEECECRRPRIRQPRGMEGALLEMAERAEVLLVYVCVVDSLVLALALVLVLVEMCGCRADGVREAPRGAPVSSITRNTPRGARRRLSRSDPMLSSAWRKEVTPREEVTLRLSSAWRQEVTPRPQCASAARMRANAREAPPTPGAPVLPPSCARWRAEQGRAEVV
jgi:hypothetical protein